MNDWQTWTAASVVVMTAGIFVLRILTRKKTGCGTGCGCPKPEKSR